MGSRYRVPTIPGNARLLLSERASHAEWLKSRKSGIGGSDIGALLGVSEYATSFSVWRDKVGESKDISGRPEIEWGHLLEDPVALKAAKELGLTARTGGGLWQHADHPFALVTPDRIATRRRSWTGVGLIECKTAGSDEDWAEGHAPLAYQAQVQWQLGITGFDIGWLACLVLGSSRDFYLVEIKFDKDWFGEMVEVARNFWYQNVVALEPPMIDLAHPITDEILKELHPKVIRPATDLEEDAIEWAREYHRAKHELETAERRVEEIKNYFRMQLQDAQRGYVGEQMVVSYPEVSPRRVSVELLKEKFPEVYEQVIVRNTHRRLTIAKVPHE
jgi:putative phage-type endonuclease